MSSLIKPNLNYTHIYEEPLVDAIQKAVGPQLQLSDVHGDERLCATVVL